MKVSDEFELNELKFLHEPQICPYCGPLFFARSREIATGNVTANGSFSLVDTGQRKLLVTCHHVWTEYQNAYRDNTEFKLLVCLDQNPPVVLDSNQLIDQDERLDITTFDMTPLLGACFGRKFYPINQNPPRKVTNGDRLYFLGYPGVFRSATDEGVSFGRMRYAVNTSAVSGSYFYADISKAKSIYDQKVKSKEDLYGGISGSPCFLVRRDRPVHLLGFANSISLKILRFTHASCLNSDGTIKRF